MEDLVDKMKLPKENKTGKDVEGLVESQYPLYYSPRLLRRFDSRRSWGSW